MRLTPSHHTSYAKRIFHIAYQYMLIVKLRRHPSKLTQANLSLHDTALVLQEKRVENFRMKMYHEEQDSHRRFLVTGRSLHQEEIRKDRELVKSSSWGKSSLMDDFGRFLRFVISQKSNSLKVVPSQWPKAALCRYLSAFWVASFCHRKY